MTIGGALNKVANHMMLLAIALLPWVIVNCMGGSGARVDRDWIESP